MLNQLYFDILDSLYQEFKLIINTPKPMYRRRKEGLYVISHSLPFIYGYMASDIR